MAEEQLENQSRKQNMIRFAQSDLVMAAIDIFKDGIDQTPLIGDNEFSTIVNAVRFDTQSELIRRFVERVEAIKQGAMHEIK